MQGSCATLGTAESLSLGFAMLAFGKGFMPEELMLPLPVAIVSSSISNKLMERCSHLKNAHAKAWAF